MEHTSTEYHKVQEASERTVNKRVPINELQIINLWKEGKIFSYPLQESHISEKSLSVGPFIFILCCISSVYNSSNNKMANLYESKIEE